ncbi:hypothetical protein B6N60_03842 [Richelia sinica FACHB-800]|uniref:Uncharacterized protein n=1 Tax=Richelia sinica FACHB-800 TaxID=1357546 RepID=A0A975TAH2_9NOST|nr:hypothetical protein B6N60_03842 [Richelia sinica FACHB-800]
MFYALIVNLNTHTYGRMMARWLSSGSKQLPEFWILFCSGCEKVYLQSQL